MAIVSKLPPDGQRRIVARIQALFAQADAIEAVVEAARRRLDRLDQAVLARAFRGELVPQNLDDEPAAVLLERIQREREARKAGKPRRKAESRQRRRTDAEEEASER